MDSPCVDATAWIEVDEETMFTCEIAKFSMDGAVDITKGRSSDTSWRRDNPVMI